jgi:hypothetical protein
LVFCPSFRKKKVFILQLLVSIKVLNKPKLKKLYFKGKAHL